MRSIPSALASAIESGAARLCHVWTLTRLDGERLAFTDHDRDLDVGDLTARAASGLSPGAAETAAAFAPGAATALGALDANAISEADIQAGLYDGAQIECRRLDWSDPDHWVSLWRGRISRLKREGGGFVAEIEGPLAALDQVAGRTFGRSCDANLGDGRCQVSPSHPDFGAGCDKRFATCGERFDNTLNFQGFPTLPGDDFLLAVARSGAVNDGSSRRG